MAEHAPSNRHIPDGMHRVTVPGRGTYAIVGVGDGHGSTGWNVKFRPEGGTAFAPGFAVYRTTIHDDMTWTLDFRGAHGLDEEAGRAVEGPLNEWLAAHQGQLLFDLLGAAGAELRKLGQDRDTHSFRVGAHEGAVARDAAMPAGSNQPREHVTGALARVREAQARFEAAVATREEVLTTVLKVIRPFSHDEANRQSVDELLQAAREERGLGSVPSP